MFKRFLLLSIHEKIEDELILQDKKRLEEFLRSKEKKILPMKYKCSCGGS